VSAELESSLKELAAELHITPEAAEQIWKDYHSKKNDWDKADERLVSEQPQLKPSVWRATNPFDLFSLTRAKRAPHKGSKEGRSR
jgi:hypothetical protein